MTNPLFDDALVHFLLHEVHDADGLTSYPHFEDHSRETFDAVVETCRRLARERLWPSYPEVNAHAPQFEDGTIRVHPDLHGHWQRLVDLGLINMTRPYEVGGQQVPHLVATAAHSYLMAADLSAFSYVGLTTGAAHLIEAFGDDETKEHFLAPMYAGEWTGTMALTEPEAGSSLGDLTTHATPRDDGTYAIRGSKIFISGGDHDLTDNIVHLTLARIDGSPPGPKGISLFAVPKRRPEGDELVDNDVRTAGMVQKIGWKAVPSLVLNYGETDDCVGWLIGEPNRGLAYMFQMMNSARMMVGLNGVATASVAFQESLQYAKERTQGRAPGNPDRTAPPVAIIEHDDVKRMLLRQKAIVDAGLAMVMQAARYADVAEHSPDEDERRTAQLLLDLLTPIVKSFPAEKGFESNALAVQVHGGYGYSSEYLPESWLRDQKLNSIHEGTTGIQSMDLLGRRAMGGGGAAMAAFLQEVGAVVAAADNAGLDAPHGKELQQAASALAEVTAELGAVGARGDAQAMLRHSVDYLEAFGIVVAAWQHLKLLVAAQRSDAVPLGRLAGLRAAADYWFATELPLVTVLLERIGSGEDSFARMRPEWF